MCGIVGVCSQREPVEKVLLDRMRDAMVHRGPDDAGTWYSSDRRLGLAHRRLSIIDLSPGGHQPMADPSGQFIIVFNGEIYNFLELREELENKGHAFRTQSDTEVLIEAYRAWGEDCLTRLNGMFSFCLYDRNKRRLFLARDRAGEKPLFYYHIPGRFLFASELKAFMADPAFPRTLDWEGLNHYLMYGYVPGAKSILRKVCKLPAGHCMIYDMEGDAIRIRPYWHLPEPEQENHASADALAEELEMLLEDAVRRQLIADVPLGILLSGGIDSSIVTAIASRVSPKTIKTFTISFPDDKEYDESPHARLVASHFGTDHTELAAEPASIDLLTDLAKQYDEPLADSSMLPTYLVSRLIRQHATVAIGGDGGDELFGGYWHYHWIQLQERARRFVPSQIRHAIASGGKHFIPLGFRGRTYIIGLDGGIMNSVAHVNVFFDDHVRRRLLSPAAEGMKNLSPLPDVYRADLPVPGKSALQRAMAMDFSTYLVDDILVKVDRASMLASLEVRAPFLDYRVIEFAFRKVPDPLRVWGKDRKILLRHLAKRLLPSALDINRKQGFAIPLPQWLKGAWGPYFEEVLRGLPPDLFNARFVSGLIKSQQRGFANTQRLFALLIFELWRRHYQIALP
jgi:asparagine synthase (glutamine-hydrolysing)